MPKVTLPRRLDALDPTVSDTVTVDLPGPSLATADLAVEGGPEVVPDARGRFAPGEPAAARAVQAFVIAAMAIGLVRGRDVLPGPVPWAVGRPLLVRPQVATLVRNARYVPRTHRLELGRGQVDGDEIWAADDPDVVAHETGHALVHLLAPGLLASWHPHARAIHEALADLVAMITLLDSEVFRARVVGTLAGLAGASGLARLGEGFARALRKPEVRALDARRALPGFGTDAEVVADDEPHALSLVLSNALFAFAVGELAGYVHTEGRTDQLARFARQLRRLVLRALVYAPPGGLVFADIARILVGADRSVHGVATRRGQEAVLDRHFRSRGMLVDVPRLTDPEPAMPPLPRAGPDESFAARLADAMGAPTPGAVSIRRYVHEVSVLGRRPTMATEWLIKLQWSRAAAQAGGDPPLRVEGGATAVYDAATGAPRVWIRSVGDHPREDAARSAGYLALPGAACAVTPEGLRPEALHDALHVVRAAPGGRRT